MRKQTKPSVVRSNNDIIANVKDWRRQHRHEITFHPAIDPHFNVNVYEALKGAQHAKGR